MKKILLLFVVTVLTFSCNSSSKITSVEKAAESVKQLSEIKIPMAKKENLENIVNYLAQDELEGRMTGTPGIAKAADYLVDQMTMMDLERYGDSYIDTFNVQDSIKAYNVVGILPGSDKNLSDEVVVIGAHYDHIGIIKNAQGEDKIANGANDNATGTATVMEIARIFRQLDFNRRTIIFALFSAEEMGLLGSKHLATRMKNEGVNVVAMVNFEMTGTPMVDKDYIAYLTGYDTSNMGELFNTANSDKIVTGKLPQAEQFNLFKRSDNYPFYEQYNIPAQTFCTFDFTNFDHYHKVGDEKELVNTDHMAQVINAVTPGIFHIVNKTAPQLN